MKIKQMTRFSVLALALAAVMGIAAVSYAAWQGSNNPVVTASAATGKIEFLGFSDNSALSLDKVIVPYDQKGDLGLFEEKEQVTMLTFDLPAIDATKNFEIKIRFTEASSLDFRALVTKDAAATALDPEADVPTEWKTVTTTDVLLKSVTLGDGLEYESVSGYKLNLILVSKSNADMNKSANFTVTLTEAAVTEPTA